MTRRERRRGGLIAAALLAVATGAAWGHGFEVGDLEIGHPWTLAAPAVAPTAVAYLSVVNRGAAADRLVAARSPLAERVELHEIALVDGEARMRPLPDGLEIAPGATVVLEPGGYHLMVFGRSAAWSEAGAIPLELEFAGAGTVTVELAVHTPEDAPAPVAETHQH